MSRAEWLIDFVSIGSFWGITFIFRFGPTFVFGNADWKKFKCQLCEALFALKPCLDKLKINVKFVFNYICLYKPILVAMDHFICTHYQLFRKWVSVITAHFKILPQIQKFYGLKCKTRQRWCAMFGTHASHYCEVSTSPFTFHKIVHEIDFTR